MFRITTDKRLANFVKVIKGAERLRIEDKLKDFSNEAYERGFNDGLEWEDIQDGYEIARDEWEANTGRHGSEFILNLVRQREVFEEDVFTPLPS